MLFRSQSNESHAAFNEPSDFQVAPSLSNFLQKNVNITIPYVIDTIVSEPIKIETGPAVLLLNFFTGNTPVVSDLIISCVGRIILNSYIQPGAIGRVAMDLHINSSLSITNNQTDI